MTDKNKYTLMFDYKHAAIRRDIVEMKRIQDELKQSYDVDVSDAVWIRENVQIQKFIDNKTNEQHQVILQ